MQNTAGLFECPPPTWGGGSQKKRRVPRRYCSEALTDYELLSRALVPAQSFEEPHLQILRHLVVVGVP